MRQYPDKSEFLCPNCFGELVDDTQVFTCEKCGSVFVFTDGVIDLVSEGKMTVSREETHSSSTAVSLPEAVLRLGWKVGLHEFLDKVPPKVSINMIKLLQEERAAFKFLLSIKNRKRLLTIDTLFGTTTLSLAQDYERVYCLHPEMDMVRCIKERAALKGVKNISFARVSPAKHLPFRESFFDGIVLHNIENLWDTKWPVMRKVEMTFIESLMKECARVVSPTGFIFVSFKNRMGRFIVNRNLNEKRPFSLVDIERLIRSESLKIHKTYLLMPESVFAEEIVDVSVKPYEYKRQPGLRELIKYFVVSSRFFKYFAPALGVLISFDTGYVSFIEEIIDDYRRRFAPECRISIKKFLICSAHTILLMVDFDNEKRGAIIRIPLNEEGLKRCMDNFEILRNLRQVNDILKKEVPAALAEGEHQGKKYFVETELLGITLTNQSSHINECMLQAVETLIDFHMATSRSIFIDVEVFDAYFSGYFSDCRAMLRKRGIVDTLEDFEVYVKKRLLNRRLNLVWMHGDYKIDNFIVSPGTFRIKGIIDWDLSRKEGLPLLDILYLFGYNDVLFLQRNISEVFANKFLPLNLNEFESGLLKKYQVALDVPDGLFMPLLVMFWLHHIVYREGPDSRLSSEWWEVNYTSIASLMKKYVLEQE
ncbi:MAG: phosphotransferase [Candidatus Omnitrophota bacterium]